MMLAAALAALAVAAPASTGLLDDVNATGAALAGPDVIVMRELRRGQTTQLIAVPRTGGRPRTLLSVGHVQPAFEAKFRLAASDQRVAVVLEMLDEHDHTVEWRVYAGPPSGPLAIVKREANVGDDPWVPELVSVDGSRVLIVEAHEEDDNGIRAAVIDAAGAETPIGWTTSAFVPIALAGPYAAAAGDSPQRLSVVDFANGAELSRVGLRPQPENVDIAADGRLVAASKPGLTVLRPGAAFQTLPKTAKLTSPRFAGDRLVALDARGRPVVVGGKVLGPPSRVVPGIDADAGGVAWVANGCVRYVPLDGAAGPAHDPCPTTEIALYAIADSRLRGRTARVPIICVTAPGGVCRGVVIGRLGGKVVARGRFAVPAGKTRWATLRIAARTATRFRHAGDGSLVIAARVPNGRVGDGRGSAELSLHVR